MFLANNQTTRQTDATKNITSFCQEDNNKTDSVDTYSNFPIIFFFAKEIEEDNIQLIEEMKEGKHPDYITPIMIQISMADDTLERNDVIM